MTFKEAVNKILSAEQKAELKGLFTFNTPTPVVEPENTPVAEPVVMGEAKLVDGTIVKYDTPELVIGSMITVVTPDGEFPAPAGKHTLENGTVVTVDETGKVIEIATKEEETPEVVVEAAAPVAMAITPEEYLNSIGIDLNTTTLLSVVDGHLRQVDLIHIMNEYALMKDSSGYEKDS